jgi:hypothetical protein
MKRIVMLLTVALVMAAMMAASVMPAFAQGQGPEGGNPGKGICKQQDKGTAGESGQKPLPFGGTEPEAGFENAPQGVVFTSPGSPFSASNPAECPEPEA